MSFLRVLGWRRKKGALSLLCALACLGPVSAHAQSSDEARRTAAEALFVEGRRLMDEGQLVPACAKFKESNRLDPGTGTLLNLARCLAGSGRMASAWAVYLEAASLAHSSRQLRREDFARKQAERIAAELPKLRIEVPTSVERPGFDILIDGESWPRGLWNLSVPIDSGQHQLEARASDSRPWSTTFGTEPGKRTDVFVQALRPVLRAHPKQDARRSEKSRSVRRTAAFAAVGVAAASFTVGTVFALTAKRTYDDSKLGCPKNQCDEGALHLRDEAFDGARLATLAFGIGGVALGSAAVLWFTATPASGSPRAGREVGGSTPNRISFGLKSSW